MFSKWLGRAPGAAPPGGPGGPGARASQGSAMKANAQRYFSRGVDCNMKIVVRGDRKTGKSTLLHLLQGGKFDPEYVETGEIEVANISWRYKTSDDVVKVEVWDVVDHGTRKKPLLPPGIKTGIGDDPATDLPALDAQTVDVYKGTHGAVFMVDLCKKWTYEYVQREIGNVPDALPILVLANFKDQEEHRAVGADELAVWLETGFSRKGPVFFAESAMSNGFGLMFVYRFFAYPFLNVQHAQLLARLQSIKQEIETSADEIKLYCYGSEEQDYIKFTENREKRRQAKGPNSAAAADADARAAYVPPMKANDSGGVGQDLTPGDPNSRRGSLSSRFRKAAGKAFTAGSQDPSPLGSQRQTPDGSDGASVTSGTTPGDGGIVSAETFKPDLALPDDFFGDAKATPLAGEVALPDEESDEDAPNMLVQGDGSDIEISDQEDAGLDTREESTRIEKPDSDHMDAEVVPTLAASTATHIDDDDDDDTGGGAAAMLDDVDDFNDEPVPPSPVKASKPKASRPADDSDSSDGFGTNSEEEIEEEEEEEEEDRTPVMVVRSGGAVLVQATTPDQVMSPKLGPRKTPAAIPASAVPPTRAPVPTAKTPLATSTPPPKKKKAGLIFASYNSPANPPLVTPPPAEKPASVSPPTDKDPSQKKKKKKKKKTSDAEAEEVGPAESQTEIMNKLEDKLNTSSVALGAVDSFDSWLDDGNDDAASAEAPKETKKKKKKKSTSDLDPSVDEGEKKKKKKKKKKREEKEAAKATGGEYDEI